MTPEEQARYMALIPETGSITASEFGKMIRPTMRRETRYSTASTKLHILEKRGLIKKLARKNMGEEIRWARV